jgi:hypothetical protein
MCLRVFETEFMFLFCMNVSVKFVTTSADKWAPLYLQCACAAYNRRLELTAGTHKGDWSTRVSVLEPECINMVH